MAKIFIQYSDNLSNNLEVAETFEEVKALLNSKDQFVEFNVIGSGKRIINKAKVSSLDPDPIPEVVAVEEEEEIQPDGVGQIYEAKNVVV